MPSLERQPDYPAHSDEAFAHYTLPPELSEFLKDKLIACVTNASDHGTVFIVKAPGVELTNLHGIVPIQVRHEVYSHPAAPVIRTVLTIYDHPRTPLVLETFYNVADPIQRADFEALSDQDEFYLLFYDETLTHRLSKRVSNGSRHMIPFILGLAEGICYDIPPDRYDFDCAKADLQAHTAI